MRTVNKDKDGKEGLPAVRPVSSTAVTVKTLSFDLSPFGRSPVQQRPTRNYQKQCLAQSLRGSTLLNYDDLPIPKVEATSTQVALPFKLGRSRISRERYDRLQYTTPRRDPYSVEPPEVEGCFPPRPCNNVSVTRWFQSGDPPAPAQRSILPITLPVMPSRTTRMKMQQRSHRAPLVRLMTTQSHMAPPSSLSSPDVKQPAKKQPPHGWPESKSPLVDLGDDAGANVDEASEKCKDTNGNGDFHEKGGDGKGIWVRTPTEEGVQAHENSQHGHAAVDRIGKWLDQRAEACGMNTNASTELSKTDGSSKRSTIIYQADSMCGSAFGIQSYERRPSIERLLESYSYVSPKNTISGCAVASAPPRSTTTVTSKQMPKMGISGYKHRQVKEITDAKMPFCFSVNGRAPKGYVYFFAYFDDMRQDQLCSFLRRDVQGCWAILFGYRFGFTKTTLSPGSHYGNILKCPGWSAEGILWLLTEEELMNVDAKNGRGTHYKRISVPVWISDDDNDAISDVCVSACCYTAQERWVTKDRHGKSPSNEVKLLFSNILSQISNILSPAYIEFLYRLKPENTDTPSENSDTSNAPSV